MIKIQNIEIGDESDLAFILGPCVIESEEIALLAASEIIAAVPCPFIYKSSFDKANRSSIHSYRGPGLKEGLRILQKVKETYQLPVTTDVHLPEQVGPVAEVCDIIQIPAFLCRQTDLLVAAAKTGLPVHVKKGQFLAPLDMKNVVTKLRESGCKEILLTDRGTTFGYNNLVSDMRSIPMMKSLGVPVCFDASHSIQLPASSLEETTGGERQFLPTLARSAVVSGANALFIETHPNPDKALCDRESQWPIQNLKELVESLIALHDHCKNGTPNVYKS